MAGLGGNYQSNSNGNNNNGVYTPNFYSRYNWKNYEDENLKSVSLNVTFNAGLLKISINERDNNNNSNKLSEISLSYTKAMLLASELNKFKEAIKDGTVGNTGYGVNGGLKESISYIMFFYDGKVNVAIGTFNSSTGEIESRTIFTFNSKDFNTSNEWTNYDNFDTLTRVTNDNVELDQFIWLCEDFARFSSGAAGYSALDLNRYESSRISNKLDPIYDKLGIERYKNSNGSGSGFKQSSFLNSKVPESSMRRNNSSSFEDIESYLTDND